ncbi:transcription factor HES-5-like, partial [Tachysurus ichikawai]
ILEMTVSFLRRQQQQQQQQPAFSSSSAAVNQSFSRCVHDIVHFLSKEELSSTEQQIISKEKTSVKSSLWRPW